MKRSVSVLVLAIALLLFAMAIARSTEAAYRLKGHLLGGGAPIANSIVTLFAASARPPKELAQAHSDAHDRFTLTIPGARAADGTLYIVAQCGQATANKGSGDNSRIALTTVVGSKPPARVTINEVTTIASVWTHNQFTDGITIQGSPLGAG